MASPSDPLASGPLILLDVHAGTGGVGGAVAHDLAVRYGRSAGRTALAAGSAGAGSELPVVDNLESGLSPDQVVVAVPKDLAPIDVRRRVRGSTQVVWLRSGSTASTVPAVEDLAVATTAADVVIDVDPTGANSSTAVADQLVESLSSAATAEADIELDMTFADGKQSHIVVGRGVSERLSEFVGKAGRVAVVTQAGIGLQVDSGVEQRVFEVPDGEAAKRMDVVADLASRFAQWGMTRADLVVAVGGGVVTDLGGFVAASYHRGIAVVHVATSLLGQVDAAIGGKCGVNLPEGKNLVGAFWQPRAVLCEIDALDTLPVREFTSGMGELAKYHFLGGGDLDRLALARRVADAASIKADVVVNDEREGGRRAILNYGHTLAHALETAGGYDLRHGEAVGIGLVYAAELARRLGRIDDERVAEHRRVVAGYGLSTAIPSGYDLDQLVELFSRDKKALSGITFVLDGPNGVESVQVEDKVLLRETLDALR